MLNVRTWMVLAVVGVSFTASAADEWPVFRGPGMQGIAAGKGIPTSFSETENVKWKVAIPGQGWSSPVVSGKQIWMTTALNDGKILRAICCDFDTGKIVHDVQVFDVPTPQPKHALNSYASPTPVLEGNRVYVHFGAHGTACLDTETAKILWTNQELVIDHKNGPGGSPILYKDKLIFCCDGADIQYMVALNKETGKIAWKTPRSHVSDKGPDRRKAYGTPVIFNIDGKEQAIATGAECFYAHDLDTGKELWRLRHPGYSNVPLPVYGNGLLYLCTGFDRGEIWGVKPGTEGDVTDTNVVWKVKIQAPTQPSPLVVGERLYMVSDGGVLSCLNAKDGTLVWKEPLGGEYSASPTLIDGKIYLFNRSGLNIVFEPGDAFRVVAKNTLESGFMASPAVVGNAMILRTKTHLYRVQK